MVSAQMMLRECWWLKIEPKAENGIDTTLTFFQISKLCPGHSCLTSREDTCCLIISAFCIQCLLRTVLLDTVFLRWSASSTYRAIYGRA